MIHCWHYRRIISRSADEDAPLPPAAQAHVAQCPGCRRLYVTDHQIIRRLSATAAAQKQEQPPPSLHARIMAGIPSSQFAARRASEPAHLRWPLALATACVVLAAILLWPARPGHKPAPAQMVQLQPSRAVPTLSPMPWPDPAPLTQWAEKLDNPLQTEMHAVLHDARGAVTALADNFLPEKLRQTLLKETLSQN
jgi:hypothetical protein